MGNGLLGPPLQHPRFKGPEWKGTSWSVNLPAPPTPAFGFLGAWSHPPSPWQPRSHTWPWSCCVEDANTAAPGHWLQRSPHRLPTTRSQLGGAPRPPPRLDTPLQPSHPQQGPPHSLCHSVMEIMPQAAWGASWVQAGRGEEYRDPSLYMLKGS